METPKVYVFCDQNCKFESMTREQIIAAIFEATGATVTNIDEAFITKIKEQNGNNSMSIWVGTEAEYNTVVANGTKDDNTIYFIKTANGIVVKYNEVPTELKNPYSLIIKETAYDGSKKVDFTSIINTMIDTKLGVIENGSY